MPWALTKVVMRSEGTTKRRDKDQCPIYAFIVDMGAQYDRSQRLLPRTPTALPVGFQQLYPSPTPRGFCSLWNARPRASLNSAAQKLLLDAARRHTLGCMLRLTMWAVIAACQWIQQLRQTCIHSINVVTIEARQAGQFDAYSPLLARKFAQRDMTSSRGEIGKLRRQTASWRGPFLLSLGSHAMVESLSCT